MDTWQNLDSSVSLSMSVSVRVSLSVSLTVSASIRYDALNIYFRHGNCLVDSQDPWEVAQKLKKPLT
jgi:hypothetical protein